VACRVATMAGGDWRPTGMSTVILVRRTRVESLPVTWPYLSAWV
jgi:hypothetical protein